MNLYYVDAVTDDGELLDVHVAASDPERAMVLWQEHRGLPVGTRPTLLYLMRPPVVEGIVLLSQAPCEVIWPH